MNKLIDNFDGLYSDVTNDGEVFYFHTNINSPKYKLISMNIRTKEVKEKTTTKLE